MVAHLVAFGVVELFEVVDIEQYQREFASGIAAHTGEFPFYLIVEMA